MVDAYPIQYSKPFFLKRQEPLSFQLNNMKIYKNPFGAALLLVGGLLSTNAGATPTIETFNNVPLTAIAGGFTSGDIALPDLNLTPTLVFGDGFNNQAQI